MEEYPGCHGNFQGDGEYLSTRRPRSWTDLQSGQYAAAIDHRGLAGKSDKLDTTVKVGGGGFVLEN